ncbi:uncharacterized protein C8Q71DRAFT_384581 [Rhodofomes roseus]|uniref:F-box domain-containing protein n=1 Tax=Rhodofomes roseus TaxID=34475 RepID=A0ABQ8JZZ7_9APHY|nr:uncharacterized protein C8Q71DRAFT_384581 [Rhodofomes roseus]KAH9829959.1 hypothetical protein C8Q71DRAFT_384581 [Rhodofomes roseus]
MTACVVPIEVLDAILDSLDGDPVELRTCSLTCHAWVHICRQRLFQSVDLRCTKARCDGFLRVLQSSASTGAPIADYVRELTLYGVFSPSLGGDCDSLCRFIGFNILEMLTCTTQLVHPGPTIRITLGRILKRLHRTQLLRLVCFNWTDIAPFAFRGQASASSRALVDLFAGMPAVSSLEVLQSTFLSPSELLRLLAAFPGLSTLTLQSIHFHPDADSFDRPNSAALRHSSVGVRRIEKLCLDADIKMLPSFVEGLLSPPFAPAVREMSINSCVRSAENLTTAMLLSRTRSTLEVLRVNYYYPATFLDIQLSLREVDCSQHHKLRVVTLSYYFDSSRSIRTICPYLPQFLKSLPKGIRQLQLRFIVHCVVSIYPTVYLNFTDWDVLDQALAELHERLTALRITIDVRTLRIDGHHIDGLLDIVRPIIDRLPMSLRGGAQVYLLGSCSRGVYVESDREPIWLGSPSL